MDSPMHDAMRDEYRSEVRRGRTSPSTCHHAYSRNLTCVHCGDQLTGDDL